MRVFFLFTTLFYFSSSFGQNCPELFLKVLSQKIQIKKIDLFKKKWLAEKVHVLEQNRRFIKASRDHSSQRSYFQIENAVLKELNDKVLMDKDLVTSLDMFLKKDLLNRVNDSSLLKEHLISFYVDFKSLRFHFDGQYGLLKSELNKIYHESIDRFVNQVNELELMKQYSKVRGLSSNPKYWYMAGIGKSNDQANFASRIGRTLFLSGKGNHLIDFHNHLKLFTGNLVKIDYLRRSLLQTSSELYDATGVIKLDVIEVLRKVKADNIEEYFAYLGKRLKNRYGKEYARAELLKLREYYTLSDLFSPALLIEQRVVIDMSQTVAGNISVDIAGMGARNMHELLISLIESQGKEVQDALDLVRRSEIRATEQLEHLRKVISRAIEEVETIRKTNVNPRIQSTGDDLVFFPTNGAYERRHKIKFMEVLTKSDDASSFRVVFLPQKNSKHIEISYTTRMDYILKGEELEKSLRLRLEEQMPFDRLKKITIASDLQILENSLDFNLIINGANHDELKLIQQNVKEILSQNNSGSLREIINI